MVKTIPNVHRISIYFFRWPAMDSRQQQPSYYRLHFFVKVGWTPNPLNKLYSYRKPSVKPPGVYFFQTHLREGGLHNLAKTMASVLHKELELQSVKAQVQWLYVMQPRIKNKSESSAGEKNYRGPVHMKCYNCD